MASNRVFQLPSSLQVVSSGLVNSPFVLTAALSEGELQQLALKRESFFFELVFGRHEKMHRAMQLDELSAPGHNPKAPGLLKKFSEQQQLALGQQLKYWKVTPKADLLEFSNFYHNCLNNCSACKKFRLYALFLRKPKLYFQCLALAENAELLFLVLQYLSPGIYSRSSYKAIKLIIIEKPINFWLQSLNYLISANKVVNVDPYPLYVIETERLLLFLNQFGIDIEREDLTCVLEIC